jgi:hypothetical protein
MTSAFCSKGGRRGSSQREAQEACTTLLPVLLLPLTYPASLSLLSLCPKSSACPSLQASSSMSGNAIRSGASSATAIAPPDQGPQDKAANPRAEADSAYDPRGWVARSEFATWNLFTANMVSGPTPAPVAIRRLVAWTLLWPQPQRLTLELS